MTKHLRLIMLSLLAMIFMGGYSLPKSVVYTFAKAPTLVSGENIVSKWDIPTSGNTDSNGRGYGWSKPSKAVTATLSADSKVRVTSIVINANTNGTTTTVAIAVGNNAIAAQTIQKSGTKGDTNKNYTYTNTSKEESTDIKFTLKSDKSVWIKTITINYEESDGRTPTTLSFPGLTGEGVTLIDGKLANGDDFNGYTAIEKDNVAGTIVYANSDEGVATVDATTGEVKVEPNVFGTTTITATFTPTHAEKYAESSASYTVINKEGERTLTTITFGEGVDNNTFEVKDGETFESKAATVTPVDATGSIQYNSSDEAIAMVDAKTGAITLGEKYGTAVITAKFVATGSFANSEASYSIKHVGDFVFYESFDKCGGKGGNDGSFKGTGNDNVGYDNTVGWASKTANGAYKCVKIGSGNSGGYVETPSIAVSTTCRLSFKAASWAGDNSTISVTISSGKLTYNNGEPTQTITINPNDKEWTDYSMIVSGTNPFTVKFACSGKDNRFFLDEVMVTKVAPQEITLDENSKNIVAAAENVNVTLKRTFYKDGEWNTLCLPFAVADAKTAFDDAVLREVDTQNSHDNTIVFKEATAIEAGKPYLIKWANSSSDAVNVEKKFEGVTLVADATPVVVNKGISFKGFYKMTAAGELGGTSVAAIGAGNKLFKVTAGEMKGFRAAFVLSSGAEATGYKVVIDGTATGIEDLVIDGVKANGRVYNLNGQYVGNSLNGLQPGLYIQNGKKVVVK